MLEILNEAHAQCENLKEFKALHRFLSDGHVSHRLDWNNHRIAITPIIDTRAGVVFLNIIRYLENRNMLDVDAELKKEIENDLHEIITGRRTNDEQTSSNLRQI